MHDPLHRLRSLTAWISIGALLGVGCGGASSYRQLVFAYFEPPALEDPWSPKIAGWQSRERADWGAGSGVLPPASVGEPGAALPPVGEPASNLRAKYEAFRSERKRRLARDLARWIQSQAKEHYVPDGPLDHWATLEETLGSNGDDCDGLELLVFHLLRDLGFPSEEVFRAIVQRPSDGQHHMVTFWFEEPEDPWVIDPTGAMTTGMPRMSQVEGWVPLKVFSDRDEYTVRTARPDTDSDSTRLR